jgi:hypothetical protein
MMLSAAVQQDFAPVLEVIEPQADRVSPSPDSSTDRSSADCSGGPKFAVTCPLAVQVLADRPSLVDNCAT